jgi:hypothetical protein
MRRERERRQMDENATNQDLTERHAPFVSVNASYRQLLVQMSSRQDTGIVTTVRTKITMAGGMLVGAEVSFVRWRYAWQLVSLLLLCVPTACFGQTVTIRLINATNGSGLPKQQVSVSGLHEKDSPTDKPELRLVTDDNGEAQFELPKPVPVHFTVHADISDARWHCDCMAFVATTEVMQKGFMTRPPDDEVTPTQPAAQLKPGYILFRARPTPWWVRVLYPLMKG